MSQSTYLSQINPDLQSLGYEADMLYYTSDDVKLSSVEFNSRLGKYRRSLSSLQFGSSSDINIANFDFLGSCYLQVKLPLLPAGVTLPQAFLLHAIDYITFSWGTSNISLVKISGQDMLHHNYMACETKEKRDKMMLLAGAVSPISGAIGIVNHTATILLKFPWSVMSCDERKKLFDTRLLDTNMLIQIAFNPVEKICGWAAGVVPPASFLSAELLIKQNELSDHSRSLYTKMKADKSAIYHYPFQHLQTGTIERFVSDGTPQDVDFELTSFLNSDLIGILFSVCRTKDISRQTDNYPHPNPFELSKVTNVKLEYNGQVLFFAVEDLLELSTLNISEGDTTANLHSLDPLVGTAVAGQLDLSYTHYIPFTQYKNITFGKEFNNCSIFRSQPLNLSFTYAKALGITNPVSLSEQITVRTTYIYNAYSSVKDFSSSIHFG